MESPHGSNVILLLGAGASCEAGLPLLGELTDLVRKTLPDHLRRLYEELRTDNLLAHERDGRNVEDILTAADGLAAARLFHGGTGPRIFAILAHEVRKQIWYQLTRRGAVGYLDGLDELRRKWGALRIASLNNDLVIETWAKRSGLRLCRGFGGDNRFDARVLEGSVAPIQLAKLHGSTDWSFETKTGLKQFQGSFRTAEGVIPARSPVPDVAMIFPSRVKVLQIEPLRQLFGQFSSWLSNARVLVVVGCQLTDEHVVETILESCRRNSKLRILIADPNAGVVIERLVARGQGLHLGERIDGLCWKFGAALESGRLWSAARRLIQGSLSLGRSLVLALEGAACEKGALRRVASQIEDHCPETIELNESLELLRAVLPPEGVEGACASLARRVEQLLRQASETTELVSALSEAAAGGRFPHGGCLSSTNGELFVLRDSIWRLGEAWRLEEVGPKLGPAGGLAMTSRGAYYFRHQLLGRQGLAQLRYMDLDTGRVSKLRLRRWDLRRASELVRTALREAHKHGWRARQAQKPVQLLLQELGWLSWPTAIRVIDEEHLIVVEARHVSVVMKATLRVLYESERTFFNLMDAAVIDRDLIVLLEGGYEGEGRLLSWRPSTGKVETLLEPLRSHGGVAADPEGGRVRVALSEAGVILEVPISTTGTLAGEPRLIYENLLQPRWLVARRPGEWYCSTSWGLFRFG